MRKEVVDFYKHHRIPVDRMVSMGVRRRGLTADSIKEQAEKVYDEIQAGELDIEPIRIAWEVYGRSSHSKMTANGISSIYDAVLSIDKKLEEHMTPWYKKLWRKK